MRLLLVTVFFALVGAARAQAQTAPVVHANMIIPNPAPSAPIADWKNAVGRTTMEVSADGALLRGWKYAGADPTAPTVVFFNGNAATIDASDVLYRGLAAQGPSIVVFDYRGYGFSGGTPDVTTFQQDGVRVFDAVAAAAQPQRVAVYGFSLGTAVAAYVAAQRPVAGLILAAPFPSAAEEFPVFARLNGIPDDIAKTVVIAPDATAAFDERGFLAKSKAPLLIIHGSDDQDVPIALGRLLFDASTVSGRRFLEVHGVQHNGVVNSVPALEGFRKFAASLK
jgi:pimeloyl-ACP methyl ester carboxylesterase